MENTGEILFEDDRPQWFIAMGENWLGPLTASDVYQKIVSGEISWAHFVWKAGQSEWDRICDVKTFQAAVPQAPKKAVLEKVKEAAKPAIRQVAGARRGAAPPPPPAAEENRWFVYYNDTQFGPFPKSEINRYLMVGKLSGRVFAWTEGMSNWERIEKLAEFADSVSAGAKKAPAAAKRTDQRSAPRRPLVAKIVMAARNSVNTAICRDISVGGMQVLTDQIPGQVGERVKLNVSTSGNDAKNRIEPFVAEGVIVRILEDGRGFSFRFERLSEGAKRAIAAHIGA